MTNFFIYFLITILTALVAAANYYEDFEADLEEIICEIHDDCPEHQPICKENHCQVECFLDSDCLENDGKKCLQGKCSHQSKTTRLRNEAVDADPDEAVYDEEEYLDDSFTISDEYDHVVDRATTKDSIIL